MAEWDFVSSDRLPYPIVQCLVGIYVHERRDRRSPLGKEDVHSYVSGAGLSEDRRHEEHNQKERKKKTPSIDFV